MDSDRTDQDTNIFWLLQQLHIFLERCRQEVLAREGFTASQIYMLYYLLSLDNHSAYAADIHAKFGISKATISSVLKALKQKGYLTMDVDPHDDRKKRISLTEKALCLEAFLKNEFEERQLRLCRGISRQEQEKLRRYLTIMLLNLKQECREGIRHDKTTVWTNQRI